MCDWFNLKLFAIQNIFHNQIVSIKIACKINCATNRLEADHDPRFNTCDFIFASNSSKVFVRELEVNYFVGLFRITSNSELKRQRSYLNFFSFFV